MEPDKMFVNECQSKRKEISLLSDDWHHYQRLPCLELRGGLLVKGRLAALPSDGGLSATLEELKTPNSKR